MTLIEFLRARLAEDEQLARDVIGSVGPERAGDRFTDDSGDATHDAFPSYPWGAEEAELPFMAGPGHPARVLAEVAAKRALLAAVEDDPFDAMGAESSYEDAVQRHLALPYSDHPDYNPGWAPL